MSLLIHGQTSTATTMVFGTSSSVLYFVMDVIIILLQRVLSIQIVHVMAWDQFGDRSLPEPILIINVASRNKPQRCLHQNTVITNLKMHFKMSSAKYWPLYKSPNVQKMAITFDIVMVYFVSMETKYLIEARISFDNGLITKSHYLNQL